MMRKHTVLIVAASIALAACSERASEEIVAAQSPETPVANQALPMGQSEATEAVIQLAQAEEVSSFDLGTHYQLLTPTQPTSSGAESTNTVLPARDVRSNAGSSTANGAPVSALSTMTRA